MRCTIKKHVTLSTLQLTKNKIRNTVHTIDTEDTNLTANTKRIGPTKITNNANHTRKNQGINHISNIEQNHHTAYDANTGPTINTTMTGLETALNIARKKIRSQLMTLRLNII